MLFSPIILTNTKSQVWGREVVQVPRHPHCTEQTRTFPDELNFFMLCSFAKLCTRMTLHSSSRTLLSTTTSWSSFLCGFYNLKLLVMIKFLHHYYYHYVVVVVVCVIVFVHCVVDDKIPPSLWCCVVVVDGNISPLLCCSTTTMVIFVNSNGFVIVN